MTTIPMSKFLRISVSMACLSAALMMGACGPKDKGGAPVISAEKAPLGLSGLSDKDFAKHFAIDARQTDEAEAQKALAALGLAESNASGLTWDTQTGSAGNYIFTNLKNTSDQGKISIREAKIFGVHMKDGNAAFDRVDFGDLTMSNDEIDITVNAMSLARPTADTAKALINSLESLSRRADRDFGADADFGFGALSMKSIDVSAADVTGQIDQLVWGVDEDSKRADFKVENLDFNLPQKTSDINSVVTLKHLSARGFNTASLRDGNGLSLRRGYSSILSNFISGFGSFQKPYDTLKIEAFKYDNAGFNLHIPKVEADAKTQGDITTITQVIAPLNIKLKDSRAGKSNPTYDLFMQQDFDDITLSSSQTTIMDQAKDTLEVKDGIFDMVDGFRLNFTYETSGLQALSKAKASEAIEKAPKRPQDMLEHLNLNGMTLSLEDKSIVERALNISAQIRGKDVNRLKQEMRAALTIAPIVARNDLEKDIASQFGSAFMDFVDNGGTLTVQLAPETPLNFSDIDALNALSPEAVGFSARQDN